jgi:hypothetical protein
VVNHTYTRGTSLGSDQRHHRGADHRGSPPPTTRGQLGGAEDTLDSAIIRITPHRIISFGIDDTDIEPHLLKADSLDVELRRQSAPRRRLRDGVNGCGRRQGAGENRAARSLTRSESHPGRNR